MAHTQPPAYTQFLSPRFWPTWLGLGLLWLIAYTPYRVRLGVGACVGHLSFQLARERRYITATNIDLCFPELAPHTRRELVRKTFRANGIGLVETATGWVRAAEHFRGQLELIGLDELQAAKARGKGVLVLGAHYSTLDFAANLLSLSCPFGVTYRPHKNPLFDAFMYRGRLRNCNGVFERNDLRGALRHLQKGEVLWYAPDQDYGPDHSVYAPFFGQRAATITTPSRFARFNGSAVVIVRHHRKEHEKGYELEFRELRETFPSGDDVRDASLVNAKLEQAIRRYPHQYLWMHKRFKTQSQGKPASPYIAVSNPLRKLSAAQLASLTQDAVTVETWHSGDKVLKLPTGTFLKFFDGQPRFPRRRQHPACRFDRHSRQLRVQGIGTITVDRMFALPDVNKTAVTYYAPQGRSLTRLLELWSRQPNNRRELNALPLRQLAAFFAHLHAKGFSPVPLRLGKLLFDGQDFHLLNPEDLNVRPMSLSYMERCENIELLFLQIKRISPQSASVFRAFCEDYAQAAELGQVKAFTRRLYPLAHRHGNTCWAGGGFQ